LDDGIDRYIGIGWRETVRAGARAHQP